MGVGSADRGWIGTDAGPKAPPGNPYFPLTESIRALAVLGVVAAHTVVPAVHQWWGRVLWNGQAWVVLFFLLSAFLLYRPYLAARAAGRPLPSARKFLRRRALRVFPGYWVALTLMAIWPGLPGVFSGDWWRYYGLVQQYSAHTSGKGLVVAWTLCIEVTFYLMLPVYAWVMSRVAVARPGAHWMRREAIALIALGAVSWLVRYLAWHGHLPSATVGSLLGEFDYFAIGMGLALLSVAVEGASRRPRWIDPIERFPGLFVALAAGVFLFVSDVFPMVDPNAPALHLVPRPIAFGPAEGNYWFSALAGVLVMLPVVFGDQRRGLTRRALGTKVLISLGIISYGVYLYHVPVLGKIAGYAAGHRWTWLHGSTVPFMFVVTLVITVPVALLSYRYVESPFLRRRYRTGRDAAGTDRDAGAEAPAPAGGEVSASA